jgi:two-component system cell cycle response regulator DivK
VTSTPPDDRGNEPPLVLIVDDSEKNLKLARDLLRAACLRTVEAATGTDAIALAHSRLPDVILLDLQLPDLDGTVVARRLAEDSRTASIPLVALSAQRLDGREAWLLASGFTGYLEKPIRVEEFPGQVLGYCARAAGVAPRSS